MMPLRTALRVPSIALQRSRPYAAARAREWLCHARSDALDHFGAPMRRARAARPHLRAGANPDSRRSDLILKFSQNTIAT